MSTNQYSTDGGMSASEQIIDAVAERTGVDPLDLPALNGTVDTDALDTLFRSASRKQDQSVRVAFQYYGFLVIAIHDDEITVTLQEDGDE